MNLFVQQALSFLLRNRHAGDAALACNDPLLAALPRTLALRSEAFAHEGAMARVHAGPGVGGDRSPPLEWNPLPDGATHWALVLEDPDAPLKRPFVHAIAVGPASVSRLVEGDLNAANARSGVYPPQALRFGRNTMGPPGYAGPRPLPGHGPHRYVFQLYALRMAPDDAALAGGLPALLPFLRREAVATGRLDGFYERDRQGREVVPFSRAAAGRP